MNLLISPAMKLSSLSSAASKSYRARTFRRSGGLEFEAKLTLG